MKLRFSCIGIFPGALPILKGAVPGPVRGPDYTAPTYFVGFPGSTPTRSLWLRFFINGSPALVALLSLLDKTTLRREALAKREALADKPVLRDTNGLSALSGGIVSGYHAIGSELDPAVLLNACAAQGARLALPVLLDDQTLVFRLWDRTKPLVPVGFGTHGPDTDQPDVLPDLVFAPLAAFSSSGQRIGYGKGHYDRVLASMQAQGHCPAYVGLAFDEQEVPPFEAEPHDVPLDAVLTPSGLRLFDHGKARLAPFLADGSPANERA